jgi:hypothetical protein
MSEEKRRSDIADEPIAELLALLLEQPIDVGENESEEVVTSRLGDHHISRVMRMELG